MKFLGVIFCLQILQVLSNPTPPIIDVVDKNVQSDAVPSVDQIRNVQVDAVSPVDEVKNVQVDAVSPVDEVKNVQSDAVPPVDEVKNVQSDAVPPVDQVKNVQSDAVPPVDQVGSSDIQNVAQNAVQDPSLTWSDPIDRATKLLIDLDEHVQQYLPTESNEESLLTTLEPHIYSGGDLESVIAKQDTQVTALLAQLDALQNRITETINQLSARRRYVLVAMLRPMTTYVRRVRTNLERLQNRLNSLQSASSSAAQALNNPVGGGTSSGVGPTAVDQGVIDNIRKRFEDIQKRISDIMGRIGYAFSLPGSSPPAQQSSSSVSPSQQ